MGAGPTLGPEAAVLSARLAELRALRVQAGPEFAEEGAMWIEAAVIASRTPQDRVLPLDQDTLWRRLRAAAGFPSRPARAGVALAFLPATERDRP